MHWHQIQVDSEVSEGEEDLQISSPAERQSQSRRRPFDWSGCELTEFVAPNLDDPSDV